MNGVKYNTTTFYFLKKFNMRGMKITTNNCTLVERELMITDKVHNEDKEHNLMVMKTNVNCSWDDISGI
jgi:hypothetical protein